MANELQNTIFNLKQVHVKCIVPETVKRDPLFKQSASVIKLGTIVRKRNQIDNRKVRAFQIW